MPPDNASVRTRTRTTISRYRLASGGVVAMDVCARSSSTSVLREAMVASSYRRPGPDLP